MLSLPAVFGAGVLKLFDVAEQNAVVSSMGVSLIGSLIAFIVGYLSIAWLMRLIKKGQFFYFGIYCLIVGIVSLIWL